MIVLVVILAVPVGGGIGQHEIADVDPEIVGVFIKRHQVHDVVAVDHAGEMHEGITALQLPAFLNQPFEAFGGFTKGTGNGGDPVVKPLVSFHGDPDVEHPRTK